MRQFKLPDIAFTLRSDNLGRYLTEVNKYDLLSPEEEFEVAIRAQQGDSDAINKLVNSNLRFVISVAKMYSGGNTTKFSDLINEGNIGLVEAAELFDPTTGFKFISFAVWHIRKNMTKYLTNNARTVRLPQSKVTAITQMRSIESDLTNELDRVPTVDEVIERYIKTAPTMKDISNIEKTADGIKNALEVNGKPVSLYGEGNSDDDRDFKPINYINADPEGTDSLAHKSDQDLAIQRLVSKLNGRERDVIIKRYGLFGNEPLSRVSLAEKWEVTSETIKGWE